ncbi:hypothetical protein ACFYWX_39970 [Streptomyces sp. NPDC002888]|uniref:hypothetical protein n=1 Tax=Streptomyces sp. NPDC002888 TaxID=3364668 RepID=UPI0036C3F521
MNKKTHEQVVAARATDEPCRPLDLVRPRRNGAQAGLADLAAYDLALEAAAIVCGLRGIEVHEGVRDRLAPELETPSRADVPGRLLHREHAPPPFDSSPLVTRV